MKKPKTMMAMAAFALVAFTLSGYARIGETLEQAVARYGDAVVQFHNDKGLPGCVFRKNGFMVVAIFQAGKVVAIDYAQGHEF